MADSFLNAGFLIPISGSELNSDLSTPGFRPGGISFMVDAFGLRIFTYGQNRNGSAILQGELMSKPADVATTDITSGTTTSATKVAAWTANKHQGAFLYVDDNDDVAGGEPEGEVGIIVSNTADVVTIDAARPFSVALAANDDVRVVATYQLEDSADGDLAKDVQGVVVGVDGIADNNFGWVQKYGYCPDVLHEAADVAANASVEAGAAAVKVVAGGGEEQIGWQVGTYTAASHDTLKTPVFLQLFGYQQVVAAP